ncbi:MAG: hypothetical protein U1F52_12270 [Burkholderiales bacterium]
MGAEQTAHALIQEAFGVGAPAEPEGHHEDVHLSAHPVEQHTRLAPVHLGLLARCGLEPPLREAGDIGGQAQQTHRELHDLIAAREATITTQFLPENAGREAHRRRAFEQPRAMRLQQRRDRDFALVRVPRLPAQAAAHRLAIQTEFPRDARDAVAGTMTLADHLPLLLSDHRALPVRIRSGHGSAAIDDAVECRRRHAIFLPIFHFHHCLLGVDGRGQFDYRSWGLLDYR